MKQRYYVLIPALALVLAGCGEHEHSGEEGHDSGSHAEAQHSEGMVTAMKRPEAINSMTHPESRTMTTVAKGMKAREKVMKRMLPNMRVKATIWRFPMR